MFRRPPVSLPVLSAVVFGLGLLASMFLNITQHQRAEDDRRLMQGQITDLTYQVNLDKQNGSAASPSPSASPDATPDASPAATPAPSASPAAVLGDSTPKTTTVKKSGNVHAGPNTTSKVVFSYTKLPIGTTVTLGAASGKFQQITINGITGYILASYLN